MIDDGSEKAERVSARSLQDLVGPSGIGLTLLSSRESDATVRSPGRAGPGCLSHPHVAAPRSAGWDAATPRNLALLAAASGSSADDLVCWIDDDVLVSAGAVRDSGYRAAPLAGKPACDLSPSAIDSAVAQLHSESASVAGARFCGVADLSICTHIELALDAGSECDPRGVCSIAVGREVEIRWRAGFVPQVIDWSARAEGILASHASPYGVSSGLMVTSAAVAMRHPFAPFYNEDWLWLRSITEAGFTVKQVEAVAAHLPPAEPASCFSKLLAQELGEIVWTAIGELERDARWAREAFAKADVVEVLNRVRDLGLERMALLEAKLRERSIDPAGSPRRATCGSIAKSMADARIALRDTRLGQVASFLITLQSEGLAARLGRSNGAMSTDGKASNAGAPTTASEAERPADPAAV